MKALCQTLEMEDYSVAGFTSAREALKKLEHESFDLILTDLMMPEMDGISLLGAAFETDPNLVGIVMTGHGAVDTAVQALKGGALDYILKPFRLSAILPVLTRALEVRRIRAENFHLREAVGIYQLSMAIAFEPDFEKILQQTADAAFRQSGANGLSMLLLSGDGTEMYVAETRGSENTHALGKRVPVQDGLLNWATRCREMLSNPNELIDVPEAFVTPVAEIGEGISIPMLTAGKLVGILKFDPGHSHTAFTPGQIKALNILASTGASALARGLAENRAALMEELERKNNELEAFSYSVSHDLRAPLRSIDGFSNALLEDYAAQLDQRGLDYLRRVLAATNRMGNLIDDLLELSRVGRAELLRRRVDLSKLAHNVASELSRANPGREVEVSIADGVDASADPRLMQVVFENLLGNAWKFTASVPKAAIEFGEARLDGTLAYFIRDNGAGFDMNYASKLFAPFQRLHKEADFPGTGIGLATVHRIVERHGGRVWAQAEVNHGAAFFWTLPEPWPGVAA